MKTIHITILLALMLVGAALHATAQPVITQQPRNQTNIAGTTAIFTVAATTGTPHLNSDGTQTVTVRESIPTDTTTKHFLRLRVSRQ